MSWVEEAYFDINSGLVGLSYQPCDEPPRYFGRSGLEGLEETAFIASPTEPNHDAGIYKELVRIGDKASTLRKAVGQVNQGQGIIGFVLHTTCTEANAVSLKYTDFRYITLPNFFSICISAVTAIFDDGERLVLGSMGEAGVRRRVCHRALLLPDHADSEFVGILGQTIGQIGQEEISRLGMLHALFESKQSLKSADEEAPNHNMLAKHLWAETSAVFQGRWIWECDDWLKLDMLEDSGTPPSNYDPWISLPFIKHGLLSRVSFLFESVNMVGNSRRDYRCAVCGAPFRRPKIAKSSKSRGKAAGTQAPEEEYEGLDPAFFNHRSLDWLSEARVIGTHSHEGIGLNRAFVSEPGTVSSTRGFIMGEPEWGREENADVNTPHSNLSEFRCYHDPGQLDPVFPFHKSCYRILDSYAGSYNSDENRTDGIYDALYELSHNHDALALNLDYDTKIDNTFQNVFVPGIIAADPNARLFRMSFSIEGKIEKRYWDDLLLSTLLEPAEASPTDVFRSLPPEIVFYIISFMDLRSIFRSLKASPAVYELISNNFNFLKRQLTKHFPWYNDLNWYDDDLREYIVYGHPDLKGSDLMRVAFQLQEMPKLDNLDMISMANERRIHQVCKHIADKIQVRSEFRQQRQQKYMKDEDEAEDIEFEDDIVEIGPDRDVTGIVLHMTGTNPSAYENPFNELEMTSSAEAPPVVIPGLTVCFRDHQSITLGDDCKQDTSGRACHRPLLLPSRQDEYKLTGVLGHTLGQIGEETI
ncbi:hypothetical protein CGCF413_v011864 [Colletotrichum fructicola]|nr:hypothetical protein CGCF413_v011864 [Colletotrichum fructicola]